MGRLPAPASESRPVWCRKRDPVNLVLHVLHSSSYIPSGERQSLLVSDGELQQEASSHDRCLHRRGKSALFRFTRTGAALPQRLMTEVHRGLCMDEQSGVKSSRLDEVRRAVSAVLSTLSRMAEK